MRGRDKMEGNEDEFGILRNASASHLVSFSSSQLRGCSLGCWATYLQWERKRVRGYKSSGGHWYPTSANFNVTECPNLLHSSSESLTCFMWGLLTVFVQQATEVGWPWGALKSGPAHPNMSHIWKMLLVKSTQGFGREGITGFPGTTLLKGNGQVETCNFTLSSVFLFSWFVLPGKSSPKQGSCTAPTKVQGIARRRVVSPLGSNISFQGWG